MAVLAALCLPLLASAQKYGKGLIDKTIAVIGNEAITISDIEEQVQMMRAQGMSSDRNMRCEVLENMMESKLFLMQARGREVFREAPLPAPPGMAEDPGGPEPDPAGAVPGRLEDRGTDAL